MEQKTTFKIFKDARDFQIIYLSLFLLYGIWFLQWDNALSAYLTIFASCFIAQGFGIAFMNLPKHSLKSAMITALGLCLLFKANSMWTYALAGTLAIGSKFFLRIKGKHIFNPSLFGIIVCLLITDDAWVSPGQWGNEFVLIGFFLACALLVLLKVGRIDTSAAFLLTLFGLELIRTYLFQGWSFDVLMHKFSSGTIFLFAFFMITDPVTTPKSTRSRIIWGALIGALTFILTNWFQNYTAPIWALLIATPFTVVLNHYFKGEDFHWIPSPASLNSKQ